MATLTTELGRVKINGIDEFGRVIITGLDEFGRLVGVEEWPLVIHVLTATVGGVDVQFQKWSLIVESVIGGRKSAEFTVIDSAGTAEFQRGESVLIYDHAASLMFGGVIDKPTVVKVSPYNTLKYHRLTCVDWHYIPEKRRAAVSYTGQTAKFIVEDLFTKYLEPEGLEIGEVQVGPTIAEMVINYRPVSEALTALAEASNFIWFIDVNKKLYFVERTTVPAPWTVDVTDLTATMLKGSVVLDRESYSYRNRQYIRGGRDVTAPQTEIFTGDGLIKSFALSYPLASEPVISVAGAPQTVGIKGIDTAMAFYWSKGDPVIAATAAPPPAAAVQVDYIGEYDIMVMVEDTAEILARQAIEGGTGIIESIEDEPNLTSKQAAFDVGLALLEYYGVVGRQFKFTVARRGLQPGQLVTVNYPAYGLNYDDLLIERVITRTLPTETMLYEITAIEGPETGDWTGFFKSLAGMKDEVLGRLNIGDSQVLIILKSVPEYWEWTEAVVENVFACPVPSVTLVPLVTLYPC